MVKRKKRLEKGIKSLERQISLHLEKRNKAIEVEDIYLDRYYEKEIASKEKDLTRKESQLKRKDPRKS